jgi:endonuclease/exonuclease/phosphatase family metal-dependent hydrolase
MKARKCWLALLVVLLAAPASPADEYVKIGAWNIEHLGKPKGHQDPTALAEYIFLAGVDVLAMEEIYDTDPNKKSRRNAVLDETFKVLSRNKGHDWDYLIFPNKNEGDTSQLCAVAWNKARVTRLGEPLKVPIKVQSSFNLWDRRPHALKFSAGEKRTDFVVIPLHMKANKLKATKKEKQAVVDQRREEAEALTGALAVVKQTFTDDDIILLGDTNCLGADEAAVQVFVAAGFVDLNASDFSTYALSKTAPFDRIFVPKDQPEFQSSRQYTLVPTDQRDHDRRLSDHFMVVALIRIMEDDD